MKIKESVTIFHEFKSRNNYNVLQSIFTTIITNMQKSLGKGSGWIIDSVIDHAITDINHSVIEIRYTKLPEKLDDPRKGSISVQNTDDNECFKWCLVRYMNSTDHTSRRIAKTDKYFAKRLDFKDKILQSKRETFTKLKNLIHVSKQCCEKKKRVDFLLVGEREKTLCFCQ